MRWRLFIEEYSPDLCYIKGENNIVANALSRLELSNEPMDDAFFTEELRSELYCYAADAPADNDYPLSYQDLGQAQSTDTDILKILQKSPFKYSAEISCGWKV